MVFDEHETRKCEVCQQPVMYGSRHHQCGTAGSGTPRTDAWEREFPNVRTDRASIVLSMVGAAGIPRLQAGEDVNCPQMTAAYRPVTTGQTRIFQTYAASATAQKRHRPFYCIPGPSQPYRPAD